MPILRAFRHFEPDFPSSHCLGQSDPPLSRSGRAQSLQRRLEITGFEHFCRSDLLRAEQSAEALGTYRWRVDPRLRELHMGRFTALAWDDIHARWPEELARWGDNYIHEGAPEGESFTQLRQRVKAALDDVHAPTVWMCHLGVIRALHWLQGASADEAMQIRVGYGEYVDFHFQDE
jgi:alpha-ribazole phosphatase